MENGTIKHEGNTDWLKNENIYLIFYIGNKNALSINFGLFALKIRPTLIMYMYVSAYVAEFAYW